MAGITTLEREFGAIFKMLADANERLRTLQLQAGDMLVLIAMQHRRKKTTDSYQETSILDRRYLRTGRNLGLFTLLYKGFDFTTESSFTDKPSRDARKVTFKKKKFRASSLHIKRTSIPRFFSIRQCLELFPPIALRRFTRVSPERFEHLLALVGPLIKKTM